MPALTPLRHFVVRLLSITLLCLALLSPRTTLGCDDPLDLELVSTGMASARALHLQNAEESARSLGMLDDLERRLTCTLEPVPGVLLARLRYLEAFLRWNAGEEAKATFLLSQAYGMNPELEGDTELASVRDARAFLKLAEKARHEQVYTVAPALVSSAIHPSEPPVLINGMGVPAGLPRKVAPGKVLVQQRTHEGHYQGQWILLSAGEERRLESPITSKAGAGGRRNTGWRVSTSLQRLQLVSSADSYVNYADLGLGAEASFSVRLDPTTHLTLLASVSPVLVTFQAWDCSPDETSCPRQALKSLMEQEIRGLPILTQAVRVGQQRVFRGGTTAALGFEFRSIQQLAGVARVITTDEWVDGSWFGFVMSPVLEVGWNLPWKSNAGLNLTLGTQAGLGLGALWLDSGGVGLQDSGAAFFSIWLGLGPKR